MKKSGIDGLPRCLYITHVNVSVLLYHYHDTLPQNPVTWHFKMALESLVE